MLKRLSTICFVLAVSACAGLDTHLPEISAPDLAAETERQETDALYKIRSNTFTLLNVGWPVLTENAELCPKTRSAIGVKTHSLKSYSKRLRPAAGRVLGADDIDRVFQIADGSPAALAGVKLGDIILDDMGEPAKIENNWEDLLSDSVLTVKRGDKVLDLPVESVLACDYNLRLSGSSIINAYADGRNITFTAGMMEFVESDKELALIIGHELAHNTMGHIRKALGNYVVTLGGTRYTRPFESEADYVGLYYMVRAGYSPEGVAGFWKRLSLLAPKNINRAKTHPTFPDRYLLIAAARKEIQEKQAGGQLVYPNFLKDGPQSTP